MQLTSLTFVCLFFSTYTYNYLISPVCGCVCVSLCKWLFSNIIHTWEPLTNIFQNNVNPHFLNTSKQKMSWDGSCGKIESSAKCKAKRTDHHNKMGRKKNLLQFRAEDTEYDEVNFFIFSLRALKMRASLYCTIKKLNFEHFETLFSNNIGKFDHLLLSYLLHPTAYPAEHSSLYLINDHFNNQVTHVWTVSVWHYSSVLN